MCMSGAFACVCRCTCIHEDQSRTLESCFITCCFLIPLGRVSTEFGSMLPRYHALSDFALLVPYSIGLQAAMPS